MACMLPGRSDDVCVAMQDPTHTCAPVVHTTALAVESRVISRSKSCLPCLPFLARFTNEKFGDRLRHNRDTPLSCNLFLCLGAACLACGPDIPVDVPTITGLCPHARALKRGEYSFTDNNLAQREEAYETKCTTFREYSVIPTYLLIFLHTSSRSRRCLRGDGQASIVRSHTEVLHACRGFSFGSVRI